MAAACNFCSYRLPAFLFNIFSDGLRMVVSCTGAQTSRTLLFKYTHFKNTILPEWLDTELFQLHLNLASRYQVSQWFSLIHMASSYPQSLQVNPRPRKAVYPANRTTSKPLSRHINNSLLVCNSSSILNRS